MPWLRDIVGGRWGRSEGEAVILFGCVGGLSDDTLSSPLLSSLSLFYHHLPSGVYFFLFVGAFKKTISKTGEFDECGRAGALSE